MADALSQFLTTRSSHASLSPEKLELMGKEAATLLVEKKIPMNESIAKLAGAHADISGEQVKRVVEFANTAAYLALHDKNKTAGAESSYPRFELADTNRILQDLGDGARPTRVTDTDVAYARLPERPKLASVKLDAALEELFVGPNREREKTASLDFTPESVASHIVETKQNLISLKEHLGHSAERMDLLFKQASADYYDSVKGHLLDGGSFVDVLRGAQEVSDDAEIVNATLTPVLGRLLKEKVATAEQIASQVKDLEKVAHRLVDPEHPFVAGFAALVKLSDEIDKVAAALDVVDEQIKAVRKGIREEFLGAR